MSDARINVQVVGRSDGLALLLSDRAIRSTASSSLVSIKVERAVHTSMLHRRLWTCCFFDAIIVSPESVQVEPLGSFDSKDRNAASRSSWIHRP